MARDNSNDISPTAHYTGYVWTRHGLSHPLLATTQGRLFFNALRPMNAASAAVGGPTLEGLLLARHHVIDNLLTQAIERGEITQVIEIASGLSPRGWRFTQRYGRQITYLETDLPAMAKRKRTLLAKMGAKPAQHRIAELNALAEVGPTSLQALAGQLKPTQGTAIITEGLLNYFDQDAVTGMWHRFAQCLRQFKHGVYFSDLFLASENAGAIGAGLQRLLSAFVRGRVHLHFADAERAGQALHEAGFSQSQLHRPAQILDDLPAGFVAGAQRVRVIEARL